MILRTAAAVAATVLAYSTAHAQAPDLTIQLPSNGYWTVETPWTRESGSRVVCEGSGGECVVPCAAYVLVSQSGLPNQQLSPRCEAGSPTNRGDAVDVDYGTPAPTAPAPSSPAERPRLEIYSAPVLTYGPEDIVHEVAIYSSCPNDDEIVFAFCNTTLADGTADRFPPQVYQDNFFVCGVAPGSSGTIEARCLSQ